MRLTQTENNWNGSKWVQTNTERPMLSIKLQVKEVAEEFRMTERDVRWGGAGRGESGQGGTGHGMAAAG